MSGIYIHIPFCKQACHYCDFHFVTSTRYKQRMVAAICKEISMRSQEMEASIKTIYFGGGTPSILDSGEIEQIIETIYNNYKVVELPEITLEANPDDLTHDKIKDLSMTAINRLSIGVQSFFEEDLVFMNRAHNAVEALDCISLSRKRFSNISIDLIYGVPGMTDDRWRENLYKAIELEVPHISSYALTVEEGTALHKFIKKGVVSKLDDDQAQRQFEILLDVMQLHAYQNYEFSNFGKPGYFSQNNTAYWTGKSYLGIGPSAHGFDGTTRSWNINNNVKYMQSIEEGILPQEQEVLSHIDRYNEYLMTGLRTIYGVSLDHIENNFGISYKEYLLEQASTYINDHFLYIEDNILRVTRKGKFLSDGIASHLFMINRN